MISIPPLNLTSETVSVRTKTDECVECVEADVTGCTVAFRLTVTWQGKHKELLGHVCAWVARVALIKTIQEQNFLSTEFFLCLVE